MVNELKILRGAAGKERDIYNSLILTDSLPYRPLSEEEFNRVFNIGGELTLSAIGADGNEIGFLSARLPNADGVSYLTYFGVLPEHRSN